MEAVLHVMVALRAVPTAYVIFSEPTHPNILSYCGHVICDNSCLFKCVQGYSRRYPTVGIIWDH